MAEKTESGWERLRRTSQRFSFMVDSAIPSICPISAWSDSMVTLERRDISSSMMERIRWYCTMEMSPTSTAAITTIPTRESQFR